MRGIGNMTSVEKQMNKDDLIAYKNFDNKQYSMIPGVSKEKQFLNRHKNSITGSPDGKEHTPSPQRQSDVTKFH